MNKKEFWLYNNTISYGEEKKCNKVFVNTKCADGKYFKVYGNSSSNLLSFMYISGLKVANIYIIYII